MSDPYQACLHMVRTGSPAMAVLADNALVHGMDAEKHVVLCIQRGEMWDDVIQLFGPYTGDIATESQTLRAVMKVVPWAELSPHLQAVPELYQHVSEVRQEPLLSTDFYRGLVLNSGCGLLVILRDG